ncbi:hypothetical protein CEXT_216701 [Caerostris extrusa]|uniref:Uncharacterized protein n=1 Tax=Caerostris extrusa TaxID=172846 RepID=A0AAV4QMQ7_CAEEX|nr:hypothetical protein CEXT_216701 [Caerostris extrusa]
MKALAERLVPDTGWFLGTGDYCVGDYCEVSPTGQYCSTMDVCCVCSIVVITYHGCLYYKHWNRRQMALALRAVAPLKTR